MGQLHANKQKWVPIVDPGIKVDPGYPAYDKGIKTKAFVADFMGNPYLGQVNTTISYSLCVIFALLHMCAEPLLC